MKRNFMLVVIMAPFFLAAQSQGINFERQGNRQAMLQKAKAEDKYIFVDCFTTWCTVCKVMDKNVYSMDTVGREIKHRIVCVKLQLDTIQKDSSYTRSWYLTAHTIGSQCRIGAYPSYLFTPDGEAVQKGIGYKAISEFLNMCETATNPAKQSYRLLEAYKKGQRDYEIMPSLAVAARDIHEDSLSLQIAADYIQHRVLPLPDEMRWTKQNMTFVERFNKALRLEDQLFLLILGERKQVGAAMGDSTYADGLINKIIYREIVKSEIDKGISLHFEPHWRMMMEKISRRFGRQYAESNVVNGQVEYYSTIKSWQKYAKFFIRKLQIARIDSWPATPVVAEVLNNDAYEVFKYSRNRKELELALLWVNRSIAIESTPNADELDTKANLLYKLGKRSEGLTLEGKSYSLNPTSSDISEAYKKMKSGLPTWVTK